MTENLRLIRTIDRDFVAEKAKSADAQILIITKDNFWHLIWDGDKTVWTNNYDTMFCNNLSCTRIYKSMFSKIYSQKQSKYGYKSIRLRMQIDKAGSASLLDVQRKENKHKQRRFFSSDALLCSRIINPDIKNNVWFGISLSLEKTLLFLNISTGPQLFISPKTTYPFSLVLFLH